MEFRNGGCSRSAGSQHSPHTGKGTLTGGPGSTGGSEPRNSNLCFLASLCRASVSALGDTSPCPELPAWGWTADPRRVSKTPTEDDTGTERHREESHRVNRAAAVRGPPRIPLLIPSSCRPKSQGFHSIQGAWKAVPRTLVPPDG